MRTTHYLKPSLPKPYSANASRMLRVVMTSRALLYRREQRHGRVKVLLQCRQKKQCSLTGLYNRETRVKAALLYFDTSPKNWTREMLVFPALRKRFSGPQEAG